MYGAEIGCISDVAKGKWNLLRDNPLGYFMSSILAGVFISFGSILIFSIAGMMQDVSYVKLIQGMSFGVGLSLVFIAGADLFTGNNLIMAIGSLEKKTTCKQTVSVWISCYLGNCVGSIFIVLLFYNTGLITVDVGEAIAAASYAKINMSFVELLTRAILCNILICLAVWCAYRCKSEVSKLIMAFWCILAFVTVGFEHSIANMSTIAIAWLAPSDYAIPLGGCFYNILVVTAGNMIGGILFVALPYYSIYRGSTVKELPKEEKPVEVTTTEALQ